MNRMDDAARGLDALRASLGDPVFYVLVLGVTVLLTSILLRVVSRGIRRALGASSVGEVTIVVNLARAAIILVVAHFVGKNVFGVELDGLIQALGVTSLVVSLGLQDLIKNVVAGMQIVGSRPFAVGDQVEVGGYRGEVMDINWRQTTVRDKDGNPNIIPNALMMSDAFVRLDGKMARRYTITCDIKPGLDLERVGVDIAKTADEVLAARGWKAEEDTEVRFVGSTANGVAAVIRIYLTDVELTARGQDAVMRAIGQRGYLADWTNESPAQERWR